MPINNKKEIVEALHQRVNAFTNYVTELNKEQFEASPENKWSAGQNLDHLIKAIKPLQPAFGLPKLILALLFGKANHPSKSYEDLVAKYIAKLVAGGRASKPFIPSKISSEKKELLLKQYQHQNEKLIRKIKKQTEEDFDRYILPHPLLGKITLREMLFFTIYHNQHHLELLQKRSEIT
jgi:hypothetical protein